MDALNGDVLLRWTSSVNPFADATYIIHRPGSCAEPEPFEPGGLLTEGPPGAPNSTEYSGFSPGIYCFSFWAFSLELNNRHSRAGTKLEVVIPESGA